MPSPGTRPARRAPAAVPTGRPAARALAVLLLAGYAFGFAGTPLGHGWSLLAHLATEHGGSAAAPPQYRHGFRPLAPHAETHAHGATAHTHDAPHEDAPHDALPQARSDAQEAEVPDADAPHAHGGVMHAHEAAEAPAAPPTLTLALDKHCLFERAPTPAPLPTSGERVGCPAPTPERVAQPVETPPPRAIA